MVFVSQMLGGLIDGQHIFYSQVAGNSYNLDASQILIGQKEIQG